MRNRIYLILIVIVLYFSACTGEAKLRRVVNEELASNVHNDSLFLGLRFGITKQEFFDHCWELNRKEIVKEGPENMSVEYVFDDRDGQPIAFNFYTEANMNREDTVHQYKTSFYYKAWAPWNKDLQSVDLILNLRDILVDWYGGNEFFRIKREGKSYFYKIDGNRLIEMHLLDERFVGVIFSDLDYTGNSYLK